MHALRLSLAFVYEEGSSRVCSPHWRSRAMFPTPHHHHDDWRVRREKLEEKSRKEVRWGEMSLGVVRLGKVRWGELRRMERRCDDPVPDGWIWCIGITTELINFEWLDFAQLCNDKIILIWLNWKCMHLMELMHFISTRFYVRLPQ